MRNFLTALCLVFVLWLQVSAGEVETPGKQPPPPCTTCSTITTTSTTSAIKSTVLQVVLSLIRI